PEGIATGTSGVSPTPWIQRLSGVSQRAIVSLNAPACPVSSCHCWIVPLPYDCWPTSVARFESLSAPATISLDDALPPLIRHTIRRFGAVATPPGWAFVATWLPSASCC